MPQGVIKNPRRIYSPPGSDPSLATRVTILENNEYKITYFTEISSSTGTITIPTGATILLDQFQSGADAYVSTIQNSQPTGIFPQTGGGVTVDVSSFDALGNYTLTGTPSSYPVALIYILKIKAKDYANLTISNILDLEDIGVDHNVLLDLQGGTTNEFYHLTSAEYTDLVTASNVKTLTNKRITPRITSTTSTSTLTPNADTEDENILTALATNLTLAAPSGTPVQGQVIIIRIKDNGTARTLTFNAIYRFSSDNPAPTTTVLSKTMYIMAIYNAEDNKWDCMWRDNF